MSEQLIHTRATRDAGSTISPAPAPAPADSSDWQGRVLGQYEVLEELGRGGFGRVFKARHRLMERIVALKVLTNEKNQDAHAQRLFLREVQATTQLIHPNIVMAYDADEVDGQLFLAMEYIAGPTLAHFIRTHGPIPVSLAWQMLHQATQALRYANEKGTVHRDIKPGNILLLDDALQSLPGHSGPQPVLLKVVDFGLARRFTANASTSCDEGFVGTPNYIAPEQARGAASVDVRADLYSLGCTFYHALTGRPPFSGASPMEIIWHHIETFPTPVEELRPELPLGLASIINRLMQKNPASRPQNPEALLAELDFLADGKSPRPNPAAPAKPLPKISPKYAADLIGPGPSVPPPVSLRSLKLEEQMDETRRLPTDGLAGAPTAEPTRSRASRLADETFANASSDAAAQTVAAPAAPHRTRPSVRELKAWWRQWFRVIEDALSGKGIPLPAADYKRLHADLLAAVRAYAACDADPQVDDYGELEAIIEPWVSLQILARTEPATLQNLVGRCRRAAQPLGLPCGKSQLAASAVPMVVMALLAAACFFLLRSPAVAGALHAPTLAQIWHFIEARPFVSLVFILPTTVLGAFYLLARLTGRPL